MSLTLEVYTETTHSFEVSVSPQYQPEHSEPLNGSWIWSYRVRIRNGSSEPARLLSRRWEITDRRGREQVVQGPGVVGQTPRIEPGDTFEYHSGCPLTTPSGSMRGTYLMQHDDGDTFYIAVPAFALEVPGERRTLN